MTNEEMKKWFLNKFEEAIEEELNVENIDDETTNLEKTLKSNFKFNDTDRKYLKKEYNDYEISQVEKQTQKLMEMQAWKEWKDSNFNVSKTTFDFSTIDWENLDEYDMYDMKNTLGLNERESAVFNSIWTMHNTYWHAGKNGAKEIDKMCHHLSLKTLRSIVDLVEKFPDFQNFSDSLLNEAHKILDDIEYIKKYDLDYKDKQTRLTKRSKNASKKIKDLDTGIVYESANECAKAIGKSNAYISKYKDRFIKI